METKNIYQRISAIASELKSIEKDMQVGTGNYAYKAVSDLAVTKKVKEAEERHGVVSVPVSQEIIHQEVFRTMANNKESLKFSFLMKMVVEFVNLDDPKDKISIVTFGHGLDQGDKGFGKASTYARKYALLNAYKIATGDDPDAEASQPTNVAASISDKKVSVLNYLNANVETLQAILSHYNVAGVDDLGDKEFDQIYSSYKKRGVL